MNHLFLVLSLMDFPTELCILFTLLVNCFSYRPSLIHHDAHRRYFAGFMVLKIVCLLKDRGRVNAFCILFAFHLFPAALLTWTACRNIYVAMNRLGGYLKFKQFSKHVPGMNVKTPDLPGSFRELLRKHFVSKTGN